MTEIFLKRSVDELPEEARDYIVYHSDIPECVWLAGFDETTGLWDKSDFTHWLYPTALENIPETKSEPDWKAIAQGTARRLSDGRDYLMQVEAKKITVEDALEAFGFGRSGLDF